MAALSSPSSPLGAMIPTAASPASSAPGPAPPRALTVAGSDSGGGAGIQADLKTFTALAVYGASAITALTAQNTTGLVAPFMPVGPQMVADQIAAVLDDIGADAIKTGMLPNAEVVRAVCDAVRPAVLLASVPLVVDPVMVATTGASLVDQDALHAILTLLLPMATVVTPNVPEAEAILARKVIGASGSSETTEGTIAALRSAARDVAALGPRFVLVKGGHAPIFKGNRRVVVDVLWDGEQFFEFENDYIDTKNTHGTGCTLSAAIAGCLAKGQSVESAVATASAFVHSAMSPGISVGKGHGPLNHSFAFTNVTVEKFSLLDYLIESCKPEWNNFLTHPFVQRLEDGTLSEASFIHYLRQDYIFLQHYTRAHALAAYKSPHSHVAWALKTALTLSNETALHARLLSQPRFGNISSADLEATPESAATIAYTRFLLEVGNSGSILELRVALAACLVGYGVLGKSMLLRVSRQPGWELHPYRQWIETYGGEEYQQAVKEGSEELEALAAEMDLTRTSKRLKHLADLFKQSTILESNFWDTFC
ncbi:Phosphomethylpyrimidine kinase-domain-containing protein [Zopfochytrium polystomum]|nr:Phosphomethylpyrimidine kinase-domain-containing protein [Zopfochytrium polystomum]